MLSHVNITTRPPWGPLSKGNASLRRRHFQTGKLGIFPLASLIGTLSIVASTALSQPLFHGTLHDCDGDDFGGHLPKGFICRGIGTGVGYCLEAGGRRVISYDAQGGSELPPSGYCHLDWTPMKELEFKRFRMYIECNGAAPECAAKALEKYPH